MSHICEFCGNEIEGNFLKYKGMYFHRYDNDACFKEWLYDQTDGECEYGTAVNGGHVCEYCGNEIEGNYLKYKGMYFHRHDNDECFKEWLYDQTDGECEYGTTVNGEEYEIEPSWSESYLNTLGMSKEDF